MCPSFDNAPPIHNQNDICGQNSAEPMGDRERRSIAHQWVERRLNQSF
jgi:hypothetical protein